MNTLLIIPSVTKTDSATEDAVRANLHPIMDYVALSTELRETRNGHVSVVDYASVKTDRSIIVRIALKAAGPDVALAVSGFLRRNDFDAIFTNGENIGIPLALLFKLTRKRPGHVTIGHRLSTGKKRLFFRYLRVHRQIDRIFVYATTQLEFAKSSLKIPPTNLSLIPFHTDTQFYKPQPQTGIIQNQICSAGLEWRDYPTLIDAVSEAPEISVKLAASSPWSKHTNETANRKLPDNVDARRYEYSELRDLYASSSIVVVPLYENDFQAGVTTILEAMAMGKPVIVTRTTGQTDVIIDHETGLTVKPADVQGLKHAIDKLNFDNGLRDRLGIAARAWVEQNASLNIWVSNMVNALTSCVQEQVPVKQPDMHQFSK